MFLEPPEPSDRGLERGDVVVESDTGQGGRFGGEGLEVLGRLVADRVAGLGAVAGQVDGVGTPALQGEFLLDRAPHGGAGS